jgi:hypothetical protein
MTLAELQDISFETTKINKISKKIPISGSTKKQIKVGFKTPQSQVRQKSTAYQRV